MSLQGYSYLCYQVVKNGCVDVICVFTTGEQRVCPIWRVTRARVIHMVSVYLAFRHFWVCQSAQTTARPNGTHGWDEETRRPWCRGNQPTRRLQRDQRCRLSPSCRTEARQRCKVFPMMSDLRWKPSFLTFLVHGGRFRQLAH